MNLYRDLKVNWQENQDSSIVERQARDLEERVGAPVLVQIFPLKCINVKMYKGTNYKVCFHQ